MNLLTTHASEIPLHCNICPKKPDFSDVSHLLTHIASKGHLSNYYKMKVKTASDRTAKQLVQEYDEWYELNNLQDLMSERMSQKEKRRGSRTAGNTSRRGSGAISAASRTTPLSTRHLRRSTRAVRHGLLDPQLGPKIKQEERSRSGTPALPLTLESHPFAAPYVPPVPSWPGTPYDLDFRLKDESLDGSFSSDSFELPAPIARHSNRRNLSGSNDSVELEPEWELGETVDDANRLKGVYWPGMAMFDSATLEMRRKRNQKKAYSVVQQLQATSEVVEATEMVFDAAGTLRKLREITGLPGDDDDDDDSPLSGEMTPEPDVPAKKTSGRRPRQPLAERNVNNGRLLRKRREAHHPPFTRRRASRFDGIDDDDGDGRLTYGRPKQKRRMGLSIHRDDSGPDITFNRPSPSMNGFGADFHNPTLISHSTYGMPHLQTYQTHQQAMYGGQPAYYQTTPSTAVGTAKANSHAFFGTRRGLASFDTLNHSMFQSGGVSQISAPSSLATLHHHHQPPLCFKVEHGMFQTQAPGTNDWDEFGSFVCGNAEASSLMPNIAGSAGFNASTDLTSVNPLFISSNHAAPDDDAATVSAPPSEQ